MLDGDLNQPSTMPLSVQQYTIITLLCKLASKTAPQISKRESDIDVKGATFDLAQSRLTSDFSLSNIDLMFNRAL